MKVSPLCFSTCDEYDVIMMYSIGQCISGSVRLVNGNTSYEGLLEFCRNGIWGTVCSNSFDVYDATVVCRQLGLTTDCKLLQCNL